MTLSDDLTNRYQVATETLMSSPALLKSWHEHCDRNTAYGRHLLDNSWKLSPSLPFDLVPHKPILRLWQDVFTGPESNACSLTVFLGQDSMRCLVREARWQRSGHDNLERIYEFVLSGGECTNNTPAISVRDSDVPFAKLRCMLDQLLEVAVPLRPMEECGVSTDSPNQGFEWLSRGDSPARIHIQWAWKPVDDWLPIVDHVLSIRDLLHECLASIPNPTE